MSELDQQEFRSVLGTFATGVTVITCRDAEGHAAAMTVNSFASLSLNPPLVLWSIEKTSDQFDAFAEATHYAVNILSESQQDISNHFATPGTDKFDGVDHMSGHQNLPLLPDCCGVIECEIVERYDGGDHIILVGRVAATQKTDKKPLIFHGGQYGALR